MFKFKKMWKNHPINSGETNPCSKISGEPNFENQCAIRMGVCLSKSGFPLEDYEGVRCWHHSSQMNHTLRVEELVRFLNQTLPKESLITVRAKPNYPINADKFAGKTGIVAFINFWGRCNQGDHIDLWDGEELLDGSIDYFERSEKVYFWEVN